MVVHRAILLSRSFRHPFRPRKNIRSSANVFYNVFFLCRVIISLAKFSFLFPRRIGNVWRGPTICRGEGGGREEEGIITIIIIIEESIELSNNIPIFVHFDKRVPLFSFFFFFFFNKLSMTFKRLFSKVVRAWLLGIRYKILLKEREGEKKIEGAR